jgi:hypothetical protein
MTRMLKAIIENQQEIVESLRQQLADFQYYREEAHRFHEDRRLRLEEKIADHLKREVMLRDALTVMVRNGQKQGWNDSYKSDMAQSKKALAATDDLDGLILCHAEPVGYGREIITPGNKISIGWLWLESPKEHYIPVYRAWEPK